MMIRNGKFYRRNEAEIMRMLGLEPTPNSGSGWVIKEDGQSEHIICQLKSTDANSIRLQQKDFTILEENALVVHKIPVFAVQFLNNDDVYIMCKPEDLRAMAEYIDSGEIKEQSTILSGIKLGEETKPKQTKTVITSSAKTREAFFSEREKQYESRRKKK